MHPWNHISQIATEQDDVSVFLKTSWQANGMIFGLFSSPLTSFPCSTNSFSGLLNRVYIKLTACMPVLLFLPLINSGNCFFQPSLMICQLLESMTGGFCTHYFSVL